MHEISAEPLSQSPATKRTQPSRHPLHRSNGEVLFPAIALALVLALHLHLVFTRSINWDEFYFLSQVHSFARGELNMPLQTFHVRLFAWLPALGLPGVDQIVAGRIFMFAAELVTCGSIVLIARRFASLASALICALAYLSVGYVLQHGWAFRTDPMAIALSMAALTIMARGKFGWLSTLGFAFLVGTAMMVTIKVVLLAPAFAGIAWLRWSEDGFSARRAAGILAGPAVAGVVTGALFAWHSAGIAPPSAAADMIGHSGGAMFFLGIPVNWPFILIAALTGIPFFIALGFLARRLAQHDLASNPERVALAGLALTFACVLFYNNTYPYFFAFVLAPVAAALAGAIPVIVERYGLGKTVLLFTVNAMLVWAVDGESRLSEQRRIQIAASEIFPEPVNYFDFPGFLPEHRKANFFMTVWGFKRYHAQGAPALAETMAQETVPLLLTVEPEYNATLLGVMDDSPRKRIFASQDILALQSTYRKVWGPIHVAGISLDAGEERSWNVMVPGTYTVEGTLTVNDQLYLNDELITLPRGEVRLRAETDANAGLLWGKHLTVPSAPVPERPYWTDF